MSETDKPSGYARIFPPGRLADSELGAFEVAEIGEWASSFFLVPDSPFYNPEHDHLNSAQIGYLWTNAPNVKRMRRTLAMAQIGQSQAKTKWGKAREEFQITQWFGSIPDFIITFDALACVGLSDPEFFALVDHEFYHCAQARDAFGIPKFKKNGQPVFAMRAHDVEEFSGVIRRWGAVNPEVAELIQAAKTPLFDSVRISQLCGTCNG